jgi:hypothetical protein
MIGTVPIDFASNKFMAFQRVRPEDRKLRRAIQSSPINPSRALLA